MITKEQALELKPGTILYTTIDTDRFGMKGVRARVNGKCKTWKRRPNDFRLPMKHGMYKCFYLDQQNNACWSVDDRKEQQRRDCLKNLIERIPPNTTVYYTKEMTKSGACWAKFFVVYEGIILNITWAIGHVIGPQAKDRDGQWQLYNRNGDLGMITYNLAAAINLLSNELHFSSL